MRARTSLGRRLLHVASVLFAMLGWRIDHLNVLWVVGGIASLALGQYLRTQQNVAATLAYFVFALLFYYVGNTAILTSTLPARLVRDYGEDSAFRIYETVLGLMFIHQGLGLGAMSALKHEGTWAWPVPDTPTYVIGGLMFATGLVVKVWSTLVVGVDIYYYRDMFLGRKVSEFVSSGPYTVLSNPMYGLGQLHAYGFAVLSRSLPGLLAAAVCHALIYVFCFVAEKPFVRRTYFPEPVAP